MAKTRGTCHRQVGRPAQPDYVPVDDPTPTKSSQRKRPHVVAEMLHKTVQEQASKVRPWEQLAGIAHNNPCGYAGQLAVVCEQTDGQATVPNAALQPFSKRPWKPFGRIACGMPKKHMQPVACRWGKPPTPQGTSWLARWPNADWSCNPGCAPSASCTLRPCPHDPAQLALRLALRSQGVCGNQGRNATPAAIPFASVYLLAWVSRPARGGPPAVLQAPPPIRLLPCGGGKPPPLNRTLRQPTCGGNPPTRSRALRRQTCGGTPPTLNRKMRQHTC